MATNKTRFSIIIPTYNSAATLTQTLESIRDQGWPNLETLIIDGASSDHSVELARSFVGLEMLVVSEIDKGIYDAINKGISLATGDLICVIGSDDRVAAGALSVVSAAWSASRTDIIAGCALLESPDGTSTKRMDEVYGRGSLISGIPFCHNSMYVAPAAYKKIGNYNLRYKICADAEWVHRSIRAGCTCSQVDQVLVHFSQSGASSKNDELIMAETYALIASNFSGVTLHEAEILFKAVRRWTDNRFVPEILSRHHANSDLLEAVKAAMGELPQVTAAEISKAPLRLTNPFAGKALRKIQHLFHSCIFDK